MIVEVFDYGASKLSPARIAVGKEYEILQPQKGGERRRPDSDPQPLWKTSCRGGWGVGLVHKSSSANGEVACPWKTWAGSAARPSNCAHSVLYTVLAAILATASAETNENTRAMLGTRRTKFRKRRSILPCSYLQYERRARSGRVQTLKRNGYRLGYLISFRRDRTRHIVPRLCSIDIYATSSDYYACTVSTHANYDDIEQSL